MPYATAAAGAAFGWRVYDLSWLLCPLHSTAHIPRQKGTTTGIAKEGVEIRPTSPGCVPSLPHLTHLRHHSPAQSSNSTLPAKRTLPAERPNPRTACSAPARLSLPARDRRSTTNTAAILYSQPYLFLVAPKFSSLSFPHFPCDRAWRTHQECSNLKYQSDGPSPPIATSKSPTPILAPAQPLPASSPCRSNNSNHHHHRPCISANHNSTATTGVRPP